MKRIRLFGLVGILLLFVVACAPLGERLGLPVEPISVANAELVDASQLEQGSPDQMYIHASFSDPEWLDYVFATFRVQEPTGSSSSAELLGVYESTPGVPVAVVTVPYFDGATGSYVLEYKAAESYNSDVVDFERPLTVSPYDGTSADTVYPQDDWQTGRSRLAPVVGWEIAVDDNKDIFIRALDSIDLTDRVFVYIYSSPASSIGNRALSSHDLFGIVDDVDLEAGKWTKLETDSDLYPSDEDAGDPRDTATVAEIRASWDAVIYSNLVRAPQNGVFLYSYADYVPGFSSSAPDPAEIALSINNRAVGDSTIQSIVPRLMSAKD